MKPPASGHLAALLLLLLGKKLPRRKPPDRRRSPGPRKPPGRRGGSEAVTVEPDRPKLGEGGAAVPLEFDDR